MITSYGQSLVKPEYSRAPTLFKDFTPEERAKEQSRVTALLKTEQSWFTPEDPLLLSTKADILSAIKTGDLVEVPFDTTVFMPNFSFRKRRTLEELENLSDEAGKSNYTVPFLRPSALKILEIITAQAKSDALVNHPLPYGVKDFSYAITSMSRSQNYQNQLVHDGGLAFDGIEGSVRSTHLYGLAFDIDHSGIYVQTETGHRAVGIGRSAELFFPDAIDCLAEALSQMHNAGVINSICEVPAGRGCFHVAVNPDASVA